MKYTKEERLDIGREIYNGDISKFEAAEKYDIDPTTARDYMRLYRNINNLPPKGNISSLHLKSLPTTENHTLEDFESMSKDELIHELVKSKITEARLKKGYEVKGDGSVILYGNRNIK